MRLSPKSQASLKKDQESQLSKGLKNPKINRKNLNPSNKPNSSVVGNNRVHRAKVPHPHLQDHHLLLPLSLKRAADVTKVASNPTAIVVNRVTTVREKIPVHVTTKNAQNHQDTVGQDMKENVITGTEGRRNGNIVAAEAETTKEDTATDDHEHNDFIV